MRGFTTPWALLTPYLKLAHFHFREAETWGRGNRLADKSEFVALRKMFVLNFPFGFTIWRLWRLKVTLLWGSFLSIPVAPDYRHIIMPLGRACVLELCLKYGVYQKYIFCMKSPRLFMTLLLLDGI